MGNDLKITIPSRSDKQGFLRGVHGVTLRDKLHSCEIRKSLKLELLLQQIQTSQLRWFGNVT